MMTPSFALSMSIYRSDIIASEVIKKEKCQNNSIQMSACLGIATYRRPHVYPNKEMYRHRAMIEMDSN